MEGENLMNHELCIYGAVMLMESLGAWGKVEKNRMSKRNKLSIMVWPCLSTYLDEFPT